MADAPSTEAAALREASLEDKYALTHLPSLISGPQALVRLLLTQHRRDKAAGLNTAGFVSGYRGSPVGTFDEVLWGAADWLKQENIVFQPGVNEELAATAVWGTQQLSTMKEKRSIDGVFSLWYGKAPGVDRSGDAFKHGNYTGAHAHGGVLVLLGDDPSAKSSSIASHSEQAMVGHLMPVLYPANVAEFVRFGLWGWGLSRYAGCWCAFKVVNETIEQTATVPADEFLDIVTPPQGELPPGGVHYRGMLTPARDEMVHKRYRLPLAQRFCRANRIDRPEFNVPRPRLGLVTAGKAYGDVMQALRYLGVDRARAVELGVDVYKVGMVWPLEPEGLREFAHDCKELFFIEEKSAFMEPQATALFYNDASRPRITGKADENGKHLLSSDLMLDPLELAQTIADRLRRNGVDDPQLVQRLEVVRSLRRVLSPIMEQTDVRTPFFCSGCPHNTSIALPEGSMAMSGIGCHGMALIARPETTLVGTQMGAEGVNWAGLQHFTSTPHMFQNIGDGTYYHSGLLAIRQAVAAKANITYKILYNDAVAMTGGQPVDGPLTPAMVAAQVLAEGVLRVALVSEDPSRYPQSSLPASVTLHPRADLDAVQREMRAIPGCTVIIYEQTCAAEKRRRRKKKEMVDPLKRVVINDAVCEGCGDCSVQSGCISIEPLETAVGRKRQINQSSCNKDYSCVKGFCPSFVTVEGAALRKRGTTTLDPCLFDALPAPALLALPPMGMGVMLAGIGGTGVLTVSAVLAMAAHVQGLQASVYDMTGFAQKNGAVLSHLRLSAGEQPISTATIGTGEAQLVLAFDLVATLTNESFRTMAAGTKVLGNDRVQPTTRVIADPNAKVDTSLLARRIEGRVGAGNTAYVDASGIATALCGDAIAANFFLVGVALQKGWLPLTVEALQRAIELNGVQVPFNLQALRLGRLWAHDPKAVEALLPASGFVAKAPKPMRLDELLSDRTQRLTAYQNAAYAQRFLAVLQPLRAAEAKAAPGQTLLTETAAQALYRLMAYKDEYEVARLHSDPAFRARLAAQFEDGATFKFNLAPPVFNRRDARTGHLVKQEFGPWMMDAFKLLARLKFLRGTALDIFGRTEERRTERALIGSYKTLLHRIVSELAPHNHAQAVQLAAASLAIRGYGHVKEASIVRATAQEEQLLQEFATADRMSATPNGGNRTAPQLAKQH